MKNSNQLTKYRCLLVASALVFLAGCGGQSSDKKDQPAEDQDLSAEISEETSSTPSSEDEVSQPSDNKAPKDSPESMVVELTDKPLKHQKQPPTPLVQTTASNEKEVAIEDIELDSVIASSEQEPTEAQLTSSTVVEFNSREEAAARLEELLENYDESKASRIEQLGIIIAVFDLKEELEAIQSSRIAATIDSGTNALTVAGVYSLRYVNRLPNLSQMMAYVKLPSSWITAIESTEAKVARAIAEQTQKISHIKARITASINASVPEKFKSMLRLSAEAARKKLPELVERAKSHKKSAIIATAVIATALYLYDGTESPEVLFFDASQLAEAKDDILRDQDQKTRAILFDSGIEISQETPIDAECWFDFDGGSLLTLETDAIKTLSQIITIKQDAIDTLERLAAKADI